MTTISVYKSGSTYKAKNTLTGVELPTTSTTDASVVINAAAKVQSGRIHIYPGNYDCKTAINLTRSVLGHESVILSGEGRATSLNFTPSSALTNAINIDIRYAGLVYLTVGINPSVTNAVKITGNQPSGGQGAYGTIDNVWFGGNAPGTKGQIAILHDGGTGWPYHWTIHNIHIANYDTAIKHVNREATSMKVSGFHFRHCNIGVDVGGGQNIYSDGWIQGGSSSTHTGFKIRSTGNGTSINNVMTEINNTGAIGTAQTVLLESGAKLCSISNVSNYMENGSTIKTINDKSGQSSNYLAYRENFSPTVKTTNIKYTHRI